MPSSRGSSGPRDGTLISCIAGAFFTTEPPGRLKIRLADDRFQKVFSSLLSDTLFFDHWLTKALNKSSARTGKKMVSDIFTYELYFYLITHQAQ